jgi:predicted NodU family carbamoyl transferase
MVLVVDGAGDDGAISKYVAEKGALRLLQKNDNLWDSLGAMYGMVSSSQGGWPLLSSEGRYMGAAAWGDQSRETNRYYKALRELFVLESEGRVCSTGRSRTGIAAVARHPTRSSSRKSSGRRSCRRTCGIRTPS